MGAASTNYLGHPRLPVSGAGGCRHPHEDKCVLAAAVDKGNEVFITKMTRGHDSYGQTPDCLGYALQAACLENLQSTAELLLARGANINFGGGPYESVLHAAIYGDHIHMVEWALLRGAAVNNETSLFCTPLQAAAGRGQKEIVSTLLKYGADANQTSGLYHTALQIAAVEGQTEIVEILLKFGSDVHMKGGIYGNALQAATVVGHLPMPTCSLDAKVNVDAWLGQCKLQLHTDDNISTHHLQVVETLLFAMQKV
jgi:ankyrin repeat protein